MKKIILGMISFYCITILASNQEPLKIQDIYLQTQQLQCEIDHLRAKISRLERNNKCKFRPTCQLRSGANNFFAGSNPLILDPAKKKECEELIGKTETGLGDAGYSNDFAKMWNSPRNLLLLAAMGSTVTTSPFLGLRSAFDASDLIINLPTMNEDLRFLKEHVLLDKRLACYGIKLPDRPIIELGGKIEGIVFAQEDYKDGPSASDINISTVRLDVLVEVSKGVHGFMAFNMDNSSFDLLNNSSLDIQLAGAGSRVFNSRVFISRAFITIGDLDILPVYFTIGQMFVPFGRYASNMVTSTLTVELARTNERAILFGLYKDGLYGSVYAFRGESNIDSPGINQWGTNWGYEKTWKDGSLNIGAGYIANIADSTGMQVTGASRGFFGFALNSLTEILEKPVPAYDIHGEFSFYKFGLFAEYIWTDQQFDVNNLSFNGHGAQPSASNVELSYSFKICDKPAALAVGYGTTTQALALNIPESSFISVFNVSIWKDTIESLEFRHDNNYDSSDFAGGNGAIPPIVNALGGSRNTYTAQIGIYF